MFDLFKGYLNLSKKSKFKPSQIYYSKTELLEDIIKEDNEKQHVELKEVSWEEMNNI